MERLFVIETDRVRLEWSGKQPLSLNGAGESIQLGRLVVRPLRSGLTFGSGTWRAAPAAEQEHPGAELGPALHEQTDYQVVLHGAGKHRVALQNRDARLLTRLSSQLDGTLQVGILNFRSQVGHSMFRVLADDRPELEFEVEVLPTKLDYKTDFKRILADVQGILSGLAFEYLQATYQSARQAQQPQPTHIEWLILLRSVIGELGQALRHIAQRPIRGVLREPRVRRLDQIHRPGARTRLLRRRDSYGVDVLELDEGLSLSGPLVENRVSLTLDTPEHRWLAAQLREILRRLRDLGRFASDRDQKRQTGRRQQARVELAELEAQVASWLKLEPLIATTALPPPAFTSLQLMAAHGYREAHKACVTLSLGLRIEGGPLGLSLKELHQLYEYWCYLALARLLESETGCAIDPRQLLRIEKRGLQVLLKEGEESTLRFEMPAGRKLALTYNPRLRSNYLGMCKPDMLISVEDPGWPTVHMICDAKYRIDACPDYVRQYGLQGPPEDALNVLHRYRDAIIEEVESDNPVRTVVEAAVLFPSHSNDDAYCGGRLWRSLERIGVGALPFLPDSEEPVRYWIRRLLRTSGWGLADRVIDHVARRRAAAWRQAAGDVILIGVLRPDAPSEHLAWISASRSYYTPLADSQSRLFTARQVALYSPASKKSSRGGVSHVADVLDLAVVRRRDIATPWAPRPGSEDNKMVVYGLSEMQVLHRRIENIDATGKGRRVTMRIWSTRLALQRARIMEELFLESEQEWRLYEELLAKQVLFDVRAQRLVPHSPGLSRGRALFRLADGRQCHYAGAAGFVVAYPGQAETTLSGVSDVVEWILRPHEPSSG